MAEYGWNACLRARMVNEPQGMCGDVDCSGAVNIVDVRLLLHHVYNSEYPVDPCAGNVDGDGEIDIADVYLLLAHIFDPEANLLYCGG